MVQLANQSRSILQCACHDHSKAEKKFLVQKSRCFAKKEQWTGGKVKKIVHMMKSKNSS